MTTTGAMALCEFTVLYLDIYKQPNLEVNSFDLN